MHGAEKLTAQQGPQDRKSHNHLSICESLTCAKLRWSATRRLDDSSFKMWCSIRYTRRLATGPPPDAARRLAQLAAG